MSFIPKLQTVLTVVFILTIGAISVTAQTPAASDSSAPKPFADAGTNEPNKESKKPLATPSENSSPGKTAAVSRDGSNAVSPEVAGITTDTSKPALLSETPANSASIVPRSPQAADADKWQFQFSPYFWLASLHGTAGVGNRSTQVDESFSDIFHTLKFAFMGVFEARKGKLMLVTDLEYVSIEDDKATPGPFFSNVNAKFKTFIFDPEVGYRLYDDPDKGASVDVLGGVRVMRVSSDLAFGAGILPATQVQGSRTWVDGIVGLRGKTAVSKKMFVTGKFDLGGGGSSFTWQLFGGAGYNVTPKIALIGGYRVLDVNYNKNNFVYDMNQRGPILGLGFRF
jgi:opacity protein-like surface antigen